MLLKLPQELERTILTGWPDFLDVEGVTHSDRALTLVVLDLDYRYYTMRACLSDDGRWSIIPISGFDDPRWGTRLEGIIE